RAPGIGPLPFSLILPGMALVCRRLEVRGERPLARRDLTRKTRNAWPAAFARTVRKVERSDSIRGSLLGASHLWIVPPNDDRPGPPGLNPNEPRHAGRHGHLGSSPSPALSDPYD